MAITAVMEADPGVTAGRDISEVFFDIWDGPLDLWYTENKGTRDIYGIWMILR